MPMLMSERLLEGKMKAVMQEFGYKGGKATVVCKCGTQKEATQKAERSGLGSRWFTADCCKELKDDDGLSLQLKETEMAVCVDGKNFLAVEEIRDQLLR